MNAARNLSRLYLFIHPMPRRADSREEYLAKWEDLLRTEGTEEENAVCIIPNAVKEMKLLEDLGQKYFGERCIMKPGDNSPDTRLLLAADLDRTLSERGCLEEWVPYEIYSSNLARRWTEGLKKNLKGLGYTYDPDSLHLVTCGMAWSGCLTKYSVFIAKYLGLTRAADIRADLTPNAGWPISARFVERIAMARHVWLFLFQTADGYPMGQFMDGLRAVWEPPHIATVPIAPEKVEVVADVPNCYLKAKGSARVFEGGVVADVMDGVHPAMTTIIGDGIEFEEFRDALRKASITPRNERCRVQQGKPGFLDPMTRSKTDYDVPPSYVV